MARPWYSNDKFRRIRLSLIVFTGSLVLVWLSAKLSGVNQVYARLEAGTVRLATSLGNGLSRLTRSESSTAVLYQACQAHTRALAIDGASLAAAERELTELRDLLAYTLVDSGSGQVAHILARAVAEDVTQVIIDKGSEHGIELGSAVIVDEGHLYGLIIDVKQFTSKVRLLNNLQSHVPGTILGENRTLGLVEGREGALLVMEFIPQDSAVRVNDLVVTSGLDGLVKQNLVIGLVSEVVAVDSAPFKRAFIELLYEPREWTTVYVLPQPDL